MKKVKLFRSLGMKAVAGAVCMGLFMAAGFGVIMMTTGKHLILNESLRLIGQTGNNIISDLQSRSKENNKFITFPDVEKVKRIQTDEKGNKTAEFIFASEFAENQPLFTPIAEKLDLINAMILDQAKQMPNYDSMLAEKLARDSYPIDPDEAEFISAMIADPMEEKISETHLVERFEVQNDFHLCIQ
jgi:hypothetical protein